MLSKHKNLLITDIALHTIEYIISMENNKPLRRKTHNYRDNCDHSLSQSNRFERSNQPHIHQGAPLQRHNLYQATHPFSFLQG